MRSSIILILILSILLALRYTFFSNTKSYKIGEHVTLQHTFLNEPYRLAYNQVFIVSSLKVYAPEFPEFHYGDKIKISGTIEENLYFNKQRNEQVKELVLKQPQIKKIDNALLLLPAFIREKVQKTFQSTLPKNEAGLLLGIVLGVKEGISRDFYYQLRDTGILHVVVASGSNVSMVSGFLLAIFQHFLKRQIALFLTVLGAVFYAILSGFDPAIVRATIMLGVALSAGVFGRERYSLISLLYAAFIMLLLSPKLINDIGFHLSFFATFGILAVKPILERSLLARRDIIFENLSITLAAQIATIPILLFAFSSYSILSLPVNVLLLWTIPPLMILGGIASLLSLVSITLASPFLFLAHPLLLYFEKTVGLFSNLSKPVSIENVPIVMVGGYYLVLCAVLIYLNKKLKAQSEKLKITVKN